MEQMKEAIQTALQTETVNVTAALPVVVPGTLPQVQPTEGNAKALIFLMGARETMVKAETSVSDDVFNAAAECETLEVWDRTINHFRAKCRSEKLPIPASVNQYMSRISKAWGERKDRAQKVLDCFALLEKAGLDVDKYFAIKARAESATFLDPTSSTYKTAASYLKDLDTLAEMEKKAVAERKRAQKAAQEADKARALADHNAVVAGAVSKSGETRQTGELDAELQGKINTLIRLTHAYHKTDHRAALVEALDVAIVMIEEAVKPQTTESK